MYMDRHRTLLIVPLTQATATGMRQAMSAVVAAGADAVELRLDFLADAADAARAANMADAAGVADISDASLHLLLDDPPCPVVLTCRSAREGGRCQASDAERAALLARAVRIGGDWVDFELASLGAAGELLKAIAVAAGDAPGGRRAKLIVSAHDFDRRPADLAGILGRMEASPGDVNKVAFAAAGPEDAWAAFDFIRSSRKPAMALAMGEAGVASRILAGKFGAFGTFAALAAGSQSAPGQPTIEELRGLYRWDAVSADTAVYGVVGCPVGHSMSPAIHNAAFAVDGVDAVYVPLRVEPGAEAFNRFIDAVLQRPWSHLAGLSVTIPHKENALACVGPANVDELTRAIGAVNTVVFTGKAGEPMRGFNTDYAAAIDALVDGMGCTREDLAHRRVAVLGAGGAARAIVAALAYRGANVTIYNRTPGRAEQLAAEFDGFAAGADIAGIGGIRSGVPAAGWRGRVRAKALAAFSGRDALTGDTQADIIVNCTPIGMHPNNQDCPLGDDVRLSPSTVVFDTIYNPPETVLLRRAAAEGCRVVSGVEMFVNQAVAQYEIWTGRPAPRQVMRQVVLRQLAGG